MKGVAIVGNAVVWDRGRGVGRDLSIVILSKVCNDVCSVLRGHGSLAASSKLTLDLLTSPASSLDGARREVAVGLGLLDHGGDPVLTEGINKFTIGVGVCKITIQRLAICLQTRHAGITYPITPMHERRRPSLLVESLAIKPRSWKMVGTNCWRAWARKGS